MKPVSFTSITLPALALGALNLVNANPLGKFREFAADLGLSGTDIDSFVATFGGLGDKHSQDQSCRILNSLFPDNTYLPEEIGVYQTKVSINW